MIQLMWDIKQKTANEQTKIQTQTTVWWLSEGEGFEGESSKE